MYIKRVKATHHMQLLTSATQVDYYPCTPSAKRFVKRVIWHPTEQVNQGMTSFSTRTKSEVMYDINNYVANGAEVTDFHVHAYTGDDYSPLMC